MLAAFMGAALRMFGGFIAECLGGTYTLTVVLVTILGALFVCRFAGNSLAAATLLMTVCFSVPGALGVGLVPAAMGLSQQYTGGYDCGFVLFTGLALGMRVMLQAMQLCWTRT